MINRLGAKTWMSAIVSAFAASACATTAAPNVKPALLVNAERTVPQSVKDAVSDALNGRDVVLGFDSFTKKSVLIVETRSADPRMMGDRNIPQADYFDLELAGDKCYITHRASGKIYPLTDVNCVAAKA